MAAINRENTTHPQASTHTMHNNNSYDGHTPRKQRPLPRHANIFVVFLLSLSYFATTVDSFSNLRSPLQQHIHHKGGEPIFLSHNLRPLTQNANFRSGCFQTENVATRPTTSLKMSPSTVLSSLRSDNSFILSALLLVSAGGIAMEQKTTFGKALSAPLVTMLISLCLANVGIIPFSSPIYGLINKVLVPLAVPLFLFDSDLNRVIRDAGSLLLAFLVGAISTVIGTVGAFALIPLKVMGSADQGWRVACALAARHIGGAINFVAVADTLNIDGGVVSAAIAADNVVVALYFAFLFYLATPGGSEVINKEEDDSNYRIETNMASKEFEPSLSEEIVIPNEQQKPITTSSIAYSIATASCIVTLGEMLTQAICPSLSSLVISSLLTVASATIFPKWFQGLRTTGTAIGILFLQLFFAASGAAGSLVLVIRQAPSLIAFSALQLLIHFIMLMGIGRGVFRMKPNELYLASNANVGGPTTAAAMAQAKEWPRLVLPALLVGVLGYATATAASLSLAPLLIRLSAR